MLKPLPKHRASPVSSPIFHYAPTSNSLPSSPFLRRNSKSKGSVTYRPQPRKAEIQYVDVGTQWSPIMNSKTEKVVEKPQPAKPKAPEEAATIVAPPPFTPPKTGSQPESPGLKRRQSQGTASSIPVSTQTIRTKRPRSDHKAKLLPQQYEFAAVEDMVALIADMIQELVTTNDELPLRSGVLTRFHSR